MGSRAGVPVAAPATAETEEVSSAISPSVCSRYGLARLSRSWRVRRCNPCVRGLRPTARHGASVALAAVSWVTRLSLTRVTPDRRNIRRLAGAIERSVRDSVPAG